MCEYYFIEEKDSNGITIRGFIDPDSLDPDDLFDKLFDNVVLKPESGFAIFKIPKNKKKRKKSVGLNRPQKKLVKKGGKSKKTKKSKKLNKTKKSKK
jgi:hypothetical protein